MAAPSDNIRLFPPGPIASASRKARTTTSDSRKPAAARPTTFDSRKPLATTSNFLYLGTLVDSRGADADENPSPVAVAGGPQPNDSPYVKLGSPELHPLPPLSRHARRGYENAEARFSTEEEFYSLRGSSGEKEISSMGFASDRMSSSRGTFQTVAVAMEKCGSRSLTLSTPSYMPSNSVSSPSLSSPAASS